MDQVDALLEAFNLVGISASEFLIELLTNFHYTTHENTINLRSCSPCIIKLLTGHPEASTGGALKWASDIMKHRCALEIQELSAKKSGYHFSVLHASIEQLEEFDIKELGGGMQQCALFLWDMLDVLLLARRSSNWRDAHKSLDDLEGNDDDEAQYWEELGDLELEEVMEGLAPDMKQNRMIAHKNKLIMIKRLSFSVS
ncbi:uncharacterized protein BJ212DRAFT_1488229 [Suillus subaureus]|uniref:Uncharacterized protein n=1 Tax=Suillus subaureus TaxID=48587 RepID=A0A9P7DP25_9AGAM|nr:uncharacterized protein BJ212DRAFT_1488229 [Suillus subaureus]KAG1799642.1 hypothetical protein BJ212DRAFT_1488229 [Suillus subaureus]